MMTGHLEFAWPYFVGFQSTEWVGFRVPFRAGSPQWQGRVQLGSSKLQVCTETGDGDGRCALGGSLLRCRLGAVCQIWTAGLWLLRFRRKILNPRNRKTARYSLMTITFLFNPSPPGLLAHPWVPGGGADHALPPAISWSVGRRESC